MMTKHEHCEGERSERVREMSDEVESAAGGRGSALEVGLAIPSLLVRLCGPNGNILNIIPRAVWSHFLPYSLEYDV